MQFKYFLILAIVATIGAGVFVIKQVGIYNRVESDIADLNEQVMLLESSNNEIETQLEYVGSLDFVEYIARTQLKYVMPDEIVFVEEGSDS